MPRSAGAARNRGPSSRRPRRLSKLSPTNKAVELRFGGSPTDRHGYLLAQVFAVTGDNRLWLQEELVGKDLAQAYSLSDNRACTSELLTREQQARGKRLGLWASSAYRIEDAGDAERLGRLIHS
ncbi:MAG TPA: thermonuclease family protein [Methyloceanibacter sp.]|nr:thermonuclease family protein [Methyloceanibacter sp.]